MRRTWNTSFTYVWTRVNAINHDVRIDTLFTDYAFSSFQFFSPFLILVLRNCVIGFDFPHVYLQRNCWVEVFAVLVREKRRIVVRERKKKKKTKTSPPMCRYTSAVTVKRHYVMSERETILQFRESEQCGFHFSTYLKLDEGKKMGRGDVLMEMNKA